MVAQTALAAQISRWQLAITVRILRLVFIQHALLLDEVDGVLLAADLSML